MRGGIGGKSTVERTYLANLPNVGPDQGPRIERYVNLGEKDIVIFAPERLRRLVEQLTLTQKHNSLFSVGVALPVPDGYVAVERLEFSIRGAKTVIASSRFPAGASGLQWLEASREDAAGMGGALVDDEPTTLLGKIEGHVATFGARGDGTPKVLWAGGSDAERDYFVSIVDPGSLAVARQLLATIVLQ